MTNIFILIWTGKKKENKTRIKKLPRGVRDMTQRSSVVEPILCRALTSIPPRAEEKHISIWLQRWTRTFLSSSSSLPPPHREILRGTRWDFTDSVTFLQLLVYVPHLCLHIVYSWRRLKKSVSVPRAGLPLMPRYITPVFFFSGWIHDLLESHVSFLQNAVRSLFIWL